MPTDIVVCREDDEVDFGNACRLKCFLIDADIQGSLTNSGDSEAEKF